MTENNKGANGSTNKNIFAPFQQPHNKKKKQINPRETIDFVNDKFKHIHADIRPALQLCFITLGIIFTEVDLSKSQALAKQKTKSVRRKQKEKKEIEDDLLYTTIPSIPFGAARILWQELLGVQPENEPEETLPHSERYWESFLTDSERSAFLSQARLHVSIPYSRPKRNFKKNNNMNQKNPFEDFFQNLMKNFDQKDKPRNGLDDTSNPAPPATACIDFIKDKLVEMGLIEIIHVKPHNINEVDDDDVDDGDENEDADDEKSNEESDEDGDANSTEGTDWMDQHSMISDGASSVRSGLSMFSATKEQRNALNSCGTSVKADDIEFSGWDEKKREKMVKRIMKTKNVDFIQVKNNMHRAYGLELFRTPQREGGFQWKSLKETSILLNQIMVKACFRQRERMKNQSKEKIKISSSTSVRSSGSKRASFKSAVSSITNPIAEEEDQAFWFSLRQTPRRVLEMMLDDASRYSIRLLPSHMMRAQQTSAAVGLIQSQTFIYGRFTLLHVKETAKRHIDDCEELRLRAFRSKDQERHFKKTMMQSVSTLKNYLLAQHPILEDNTDVVGERRRGEVGKALHLCAYSISSRGWLEDALMLYSDALRYKKAAFGMEHLSVSNTLHMIGNIYLNQLQFKKSLEIYNDVLKVQQNLLGDRDPKIISTYKIIAVLESKMTNFENSVNAYEKALLVEMQVCGKESKEVAQTLNTLGVIYGIMEDYKKSLSCFEESLRITQALPEKSDVDTASSYANIGNLYSKTKDYEKAIQFYQDSLKYELSRNNTATTYNSMGLAYFYLGEFDDAIGYFRQSLQIRNSSFCSDDKEVARILLTMARVFNIQGKLEDSLQAFEEARVVVKRLYGEENEKYADVLHNIGILKSKTGEYEESLYFYETSLDILKKVHGDQHEDVAEALQKVADVLNLLKRQGEAMVFHEEALEVRKNVLGENHKDVASSYNNLGVMHYKAGDNDKALTLFEEALRIRKEIFDERDEKVGDTLHNMGLVYKNKEKYEQALEYYENALSIRKEKLGISHPKTADTLYNIGVVHTSTENFSAACEAYEEAVVAYKKSGYSVTHPNVSNTLSWIRYCKKKMSKPGT